jgi:hypothetical protein
MTKKTSMLLAIATTAWVGMITWILTARNPLGSGAARDGLLSSGWLPLVAHFVSYAGLATLLFVWLTNIGGRSGIRRRSIVVLVFLATASHGVFMELLQASVPGRTPSMWDVAVNAAGALTALVFVTAISSIQVHRSKSKLIFCSILKGRRVRLTPR